MVRAAIAAEEEYKDTLCTYAGAPAPVHSSIAEPSLLGHVPSKPAPDGPLLVHPLVLDVEPATLQASILRSPNRDASVDRSPPAATLHQPVGGWSGRQGSRGPSARLPSLPSQPHHLQGPSHSRPLAANRTCVPPVSAHVGYITVQVPQALLRKQIADANGESPGKRGYWQGVGELPRGGAGEPTPDRHTPGTHWHLRDGHARAGHARACNGHARAPNRHARAETRSRIDTLAFAKPVPRPGARGSPRQFAPRKEEDGRHRSRERRQ